jgi:class 3 adenylate cyclase/CHASE2 domain-containing sensor protein
MMDCRVKLGNDWCGSRRAGNALVDLGDWSLRHWRPLAGLTTALLVAAGALAGYASDYDSRWSALGGPNALLYDLTLKIAQPWRRHIPTAPMVFVAVDNESLATPELAALPRALFQPIWTRLIDGLLDAGARRIAFDVVFAYAGADFKVESFTLPDYDRGLIDTLARGRDRLVIARFPTVPPAAPFLATVGASRVGVLDLQVESDGRVRSTAPVVRLPDGRVALGFAALGAGWSVRQAASAQRILLAPVAPLADTPTYSLATLLACLKSKDGLEEVRKAVEGRIVVVGTTIAGEDEHRGPARFLGLGLFGLAGESCAPQPGLLARRGFENVPGALLQIAAIQSAASDRRVTLASPWLRLAAGAALALLFALAAFRDESALALGERDISPASIIFVQLARAAAFGVVGPAVVGGVASAIAFVWADLWLPMGYPVLVTMLAFGTILGLRSLRHRALFRRLYRTAGRYLPPARLVTLARGGFGDPLDGQEREVSIVLADLVGFTAFSNRPDLSASEIVRVANRYFTLMQAVIDVHEGCSDKFLGDAVLAFWNGLADEPAHPVKALAAAQDIITAVKAAEGSDQSRLAARAVVCSGRVYVGDLGAKQRSNFTIIGPAVNETFRLEKIPDVYGLSVLLAASTAEMILAAKSEIATAGVLGDNVLLRVDDLDLKGFAEARAIYALVPRDDPGLARFEAGRQALDQGRVGEGLDHLAAVDGGMLQQAAKVVSARYQPAP